MSPSKTKKLNLRRATLRLLNQEEMARIDGGGRILSIDSNCGDCSNTCNTCIGNTSCKGGGV